MRPVPTDREGRSMVCAVEGCGVHATFGISGRNPKGERDERRLCPRHFPLVSVEAARRAMERGQAAIAAPGPAEQGRFL